MKKHLIVGTGAAGLAALKQIRSITGDDQITLVSMEDTLPYSPTALPYLLSGKIDESKLWIVDEEYFKEMRSNLALNHQVVQVNHKQKAVTYQGGKTEKYDTLLLATGSEPVMPTIEGIENIEVLGYHTLEDHKKLIKQLGKGGVALIYGGGLVAMGLASGLIKRGCKVILVVRSRILRRYFDSDAGSLIADVFRSQGAEIILGKNIKRMDKNGNGVKAFLSDDSSVSGDVFISCLGTVPRVAFLEDSGIELNVGVVVDDRLQTSKQDIYAAGDIAVAKDFFTGKPGINAILPSAVEQGKVAGANMAGEVKEYEGWISMNVFHFFGNGACSMGISETNEEIEVLKDQDKNNKSFKKLSFQNGQLVGAEFVNIEVDPGVFLYLIKKRLDIDKHKELLFQKPIEVSRWLMTRNERGED